MAIDKTTLQIDIKKDREVLSRSINSSMYNFIYK